MSATAGNSDTEIFKANKIRIFGRSFQKAASVARPGFLEYFREKEEFGVHYCIRNNGNPIKAVSLIKLLGH